MRRQAAVDAVAGRAKIMVDVTEVGEHGFMSVFTDPTGAHLALWQAKPGAKH